LSPNEVRSTATLAVVEQCPEGVADVEVSGAVLEVVRHEQHLADVAAAAAQRPLVGLDQAALADGRHGLQPGEFLGPAVEAHPAHARPHGPGTDEHDLAAARQHGVELPAEGFDSGGIEQAVGAGEHASAHLDDDQSCGGDEFGAQRFAHRGRGTGEAGRGSVGAAPANPTRSPAGATTGAAAGIRGLTARG